MNTREIPLPDGSVCLIDQADWDLVRGYHWYRVPTGYVAAGVYQKVRGREWMPLKERCRLVLMHRLLMEPPPGMHTDHVNGNGLDNRRANLRVVTPGLNALNRHDPTTAASGVRGVRRTMGSATWTAYHTVLGRQIHLGCFPSKDDAAAARKGAIAARWAQA